MKGFGLVGTKANKPPIQEKLLVFSRTNKTNGSCLLYTLLKCLGSRQTSCLKPNWVQAAIKAG
jgi:hypothetical protein